MIVSDKITRTAARRSYKVGVAGIGDSILAAGAEDHTTHLEKLCILSGQRHRFRGSFAVGGKTVIEVLTEQLPSILQMRPLPAKVLVACGSNALASTQTVKDNFTAYVRIVNTLDAYGIQPWLYMIPARGAQQQDRERWELWNSMVQRLKFNRNFPLYNAHAGLVDPVTGINIAGTCADLDHPEVWGRGLIAEAVRTDSAMASALIDGTVRLAYTDNDSSNFFTNGCFTTGGGALAGGGTGDVVNGGTGTGAVFSRIADAAIKGSWQRVLRPAGSTAATKLEFGTNRDVTPGHVMEFNGRIRMHGATNNVNVFNSALALYWADTNYGFVKNEFIVGKAGLADEEGIFHVRTQVPAGATKLVAIVGDSSGSPSPAVDSWIDIAQLHLADITAIENV